MKTFVSLTLFLFITVINAQETTLTTKSVKLDNLISFVADNFPLQQENTDEDEEDEDEDEDEDEEVDRLEDQGRGRQLHDGQSSGLAKRSTSATTRQ